MTILILVSLLPVFSSAFVVPFSVQRCNVAKHLDTRSTQERGAITELFAKKKKASGVADKPKERKVASDKIEVEGIVKEALPNAMFRVEVAATNSVLLCTISGKIRKNFVKILVGDIVKVELSPYDLTRGRITFRERGSQ
mmetsp:Transcript_13050/g.19539  ORF Transcript_13050/g.19539 Transcript_13050/m.19539 type:complete len:140 (-) Transcript_13050:114-533(-)